MLKVPSVLALGILSLVAAPVSSAAPPTRVWLIGVPDGKHDEFEHEGQADDRFYLNPGDYTGVYGWDTVANSYTLAGDNVLAAEPLIDPDPTIGFERALVAGLEDTINIFFQLNSAHIRPGAKYQFDAIVNGGNSSHLITLGFNNHEFMSFNGVGHEGPTRYRQVFSVEGVNPQVGSNVLTLRTENTASGNYVTFDYLRLTLIDSNVIFAIGADDNTNADFEQEGNDRNDAQFYVHAGDYTNVNGSTGAGALAVRPELEFAASVTEGLPRALVPTRPKLDLFFQLTPEEAAAQMLRFEADLFNLAGGSSHDLRFSINGVTLGELTGVTANRLATFDFLTSLVNPGENVLSIERIGGSGTNEWIQFDYLQLSTIPEPSSAALLGLGAIGLGMVRRRRAT